MSNKLSSAKRHRQNLRRRLRNRMVKSRVRSSARRFLQLVESRAVEEATSQYRNVSSLLDRAASKGVIARNAAARTKRRLHRRLAGLGKAS